MGSSLPFYVKKQNQDCWALHIPNTACLPCAGQPSADPEAPTTSG